MTRGEDSPKKRLMIVVRLTGGFYYDGNALKTSKPLVYHSPSLASCIFCRVKIFYPAEKHELGS